MTHAVLNAYEKVTGKQLTGIAGHGPGGIGGGEWRRGHLSEARRQTLNAKIASVAVGGPLGEQISRVLDGTGRILAPVRVDDADVAAVAQAAVMCTDLDLRLGGAVADQQARALLRWAVGLLASEASAPVSARLRTAVAALAARAGWAAFDADSHDVARSLLTVGLHAAARADDPDLRAHILADLAAQHNYLGYPQDCLHVARLGEIDERVGPHTRAVLYSVKARAYAAQGDTDACRHHLHLAEQAATAAATTGEATGWLATIATGPQRAAAAGHALAALARRTDSAEVRTEALQQLAYAAEQVGAGRRRATALCLAQLAALHLQAAELEPGIRRAYQALETATGIRSVRLIDHLGMARAAAAAHPGADEPAVQQLMTDIDTTITTGRTTPAEITETADAADTDALETPGQLAAAVPSR